MNDDFLRNCVITISRYSGILRSATRSLSKIRFLERSNQRPPMSFTNTPGTNAGRAALGQVAALLRGVYGVVSRYFRRNTPAVHNRTGENTYQLFFCIVVFILAYDCCSTGFEFKMDSTRAILRQSKFDEKILKRPPELLRSSKFINLSVFYC